MSHLSRWFMVVLVLISVITPGVVLAEDPWVSGWPQAQSSNQITALVVAPSDGRTVYTVADGVLYRSKDGGSSWEKPGTLERIECMAIDPDNSNLIYAYITPLYSAANTISEDGGFRQSIDGGQTWSDPSQGNLTAVVKQNARSVSYLAIDPNNPQILFAATQSPPRVLRSDDGGRTWKITYVYPQNGPSIGSPYANALVVSPKGTRNVFLLTSEWHGGALFRSIDGGLSWYRFDERTQREYIYPADFAVDPTNPKIMYIAYQAMMGGGVMIVRTENGGASWTTVNSGLDTKGMSKPHLIIDPIDPNALYLGAGGGYQSNGGVFKTTNRGDSWTRLTLADDPRFNDKVTLGYNPTNKVLYVGTKTGVWQTRSPWQIADKLTTYYNQHDGQRVLGQAISAPGWVEGWPCQYFEKGRLEDHSQKESDAKWQFMYGLLADELQQAQSDLPVGGDVSTITYADIHALADPKNRVAPPEGFTSGFQLQSDGSVFVPFNASLQSEPGHHITGVFWDYINRPDLFPGGWLHDIGLPTGEPIQATVDKGDIKGRKITIQAFQRTILTYDPLNPADWQVERSNVGTDYARQFPERMR
jgi:photosystem II stability/assembly factor-like uncharacterized protein